jgi:hypothetical protein
MLIKLYIPKSDLAAYPSEDAVIAGVTVELLKLFPTEIAYITQKQRKKSFIGSQWS